MRMHMVRRMNSYGRFGAYGEVPDAATQVKWNETMTAVIKKLKAALELVRTKTYIDVSISANAREGVRSGLKTLDTVIARLDTTSRAEVLNGTTPPEKWIAASKTVAEGIDAQGNILAEYGLGAQLAITLDDALADFKSLAQKVAQGLGIGIPIALAVGAIVLFMMYGPKRRSAMSDAQPEAQLD